MWSRRTQECREKEREREEARSRDLAREDTRGFSVFAVPIFKDTRGGLKARKSTLHSLRTARRLFARVQSDFLITAANFSFIGGCTRAGNSAKCKQLGPAGSLPVPAFSRYSRENEYMLAQGEKGRKENGNYSANVRGTVHSGYDDFTLRNFQLIFITKPR